MADFNVFFSGLALALGVVLIAFFCAVFFSMGLVEKSRDGKQ